MNITEFQVVYQKMEYNQLLAAVQNVNEHNFEQVALRVFRYQYESNVLYREFVDLLNILPKTVDRLSKIPFLPIECFKHFEIKSGEWASEIVFTSSGTTGQKTSKHHVRSIEKYLSNTRRGFHHFYNSVEAYCVLALLPSYLERQGSSLIAMADDFIKRSKYAESGFFLHNVDELVTILKKCQQENRPTILLGVSFALLDLAEFHTLDLSNIILMETGGMKGRRKEIIRSDLHKILCTAFNVPHIHSEYGMTELLSQAYSKGEGVFYPSPSMKILIRDVSDPFTYLNSGRTGGINIIDLANIDSCAFISTSDLGKIRPEGSFEVLGRFDNSDVRGCNLMVEMI